MKAYLCLFVGFGIAASAVLCDAGDISKVLSQERRAEALRGQKEAIFTRAEARQQVIDELIAGRMTLKQAVARFGELNAMEPEQMTVVRETFPGDSDEERLCRQVLGQVQVELQGRTSEADTILPRLEAEMHEQFGQHSPGA
jgi:hypothetical protein